MSPRRYHFDHWGRCLGYLDDDGHYYDKTGVCRGEVVDGSNLYDTEGVYRGYFDIQGQYWDERGRYCGYVRGPLRPPLERAEAVTPQAGTALPAVPTLSSSADLRGHR